MSKSALLRLTLAATMFGALAASAADDPTANKTHAAASAPARTVPTPLNSATPGEFSSDASKVTLERLPNGARLYQMNGQGMETVSVHIGRDGKLEYTCTDAGEKALQKNAAGNAHEEQAHEE